ncbi:hypothetical protein Vqi01_03350 [Micromonospora qiuiae]|uniref:DUF1275 domain-containing protein n=1 Tax=Micromonospora qiuiae TaxID=502268 RepID=A0ABQ4J559_9ACTN|nr:YoaK family protein [Micromonospora qiuiae]GIJ25173.1 hypothetical protein Vqi01_03350 [Micromonospora qiuiae]
MPSGGAARDATDSYQEFRHPLLALALTTGIAGAMDAFAFLRYGAFVANQSGNAIFLGLGPAGEHPAWPASAAALVAFGAGAGIASWLRGQRRGRAATWVNLVITEAALVLWAVLNVLLAYGRHHASFRIVLAASGALAMGALATLLTSTAGFATTTTYQSGTVQKTGQYAVRWLTHPRADRGRAELGILLGLLTIASYAAGGAVGAWVQREPHWTPAWGAVALTAVALLVGRPSRTRS